jgi:NADPH2:quinone reductase
MSSPLPSFRYPILAPTHPLIKTIRTIAGAAPRERGSPIWRRMSYPRRMRAMVMTALGEPSGLTQVELPDPQPGPGQISIEVEAIGCGFADILLCRGVYQLKLAPPFTPGAEVAGRVIATGAGAERWSAGQRVSAQLESGGYATHVVADALRVQALPPDLPAAHAVALGVAYQTAYLGLVDRAAITPGESLLVQAGAGGVGLAALQIGRALGARVIAGVGSDEKLELCRQQGAHHVVNTRADGWHTEVLRCTAGRGADVVFESVGGSVFEQSLKCTAWGGRVLVIGFSSGDIPTVKLNRVLLKHISLIGLHLGTYHERAPQAIERASAELVRLYQQGAVRPLIHATLPLHEAARALEELGSRQTVGKLVLRP